MSVYDDPDRRLEVRRDLTWTPNRPCQVTVYWLGDSGNSESMHLTNSEAATLRDKLTTYLKGTTT